MVRRTLVVALFVLVALACLAPAATAYVRIVDSTLPLHAALAPGAEPAVVVWPSGDGTQLIAQHHTRDMGPLLSRTVVTGIGALQDWYAAGHGTQVTVVWKDGGTVWAKCIDADTGSAVYGPVAVCTDAAVDALDGAATNALLSGVAPDGQGGVYMWLTVTPSRGVNGYGDSLLNHISPTGVLAQADPGLPVAAGTISRLAADSEGYAYLLLAPPGRNTIATQRFAPTLVKDWTNPISPYSPLVRPPSATRTPIAITAGTNALIAWREGAKVKVQRYPAAGGVAWLYPPEVSLSGDVKLASDGLDGAYLAAASGQGVKAAHVLSAGTLTTATLGLGLSGPAVGALTTNRAGDLFVGYGDLDAAAASGVGLLTFAGVFSDIGPAGPGPDTYTSAVPDGAGGACLVGDTTGMAVLTRVGAGPDLFLTLRPRTLSVLYGKSVAVAGYVTLNAIPVDDATVEVATTASGAGAATTAQTETDGYYHATLRPRANATWTAASGAVASEGVRILVAPKVTMTMSHLKAGVRLSEILSGAVSPGHKGKKVLAQKAVGAGWKTVASGRLDSRSSYRITWYLPYKTANYKVRVIIPAHGDHTQGTSPTGTLRVVIRKG